MNELILLCFWLLVAYAEQIAIACLIGVGAGVLAWLGAFGLFAIWIAALK